MPRRIRIDGARLRSDRKRLGISGDALVATVREAGEPISVKWLYEAERTGLISEEHLRAVALALKLPSAPYRREATAAKSSAVPDLAGCWRALYLAQDDMTEPYVCEERLTVTQDAEFVRGEYEPLQHHHPDPDEPLGSRRYWMTGKVEPKFVRGEYGPLDKAATGNGYFILKQTQEGVFEGFCTFYSLDERIAMSINIWIREDSRAFHSIYRQQLAKIEANTKDFWRLAPILRH